MVAVLLVDVGLAIYILPKDPAMDLFIYSDGVQVDFTIGVKILAKFSADIRNMIIPLTGTLKYMYPIRTFRAGEN